MAAEGTNSYITIVKLKALEDIDDAVDDNALVLAVNAASRAIDHYTGRQFYAETTTRYYTADSREFCEIDDLVSLTSLKTDDDDDGVYENTWESTDYQLLPVNKIQKMTIRARSGGNYYFPKNEIGAVAVEGIFGCVVANGEEWEAPQHIQQACQILALRLFHRKEAWQGIAGSNDFGSITFLPEFDVDVKTLIEPEVRLV